LAELKRQRMLSPETAARYEEFLAAKDDPQHRYWGNDTDPALMQPASGTPEQFAEKQRQQFAGMYAPASGTPEQLEEKQRQYMAARLQPASGTPEQLAEKQAAYDASRRPIQNDELERKRIMLALMSGGRQ
jgi:hypothetical protein